MPKLVPSVDREKLSVLRKRAQVRSREIRWREKFAWAYRERIGTVLTSAEVRDLVDEFDAMCAEREGR